MLPKLAVLMAVYNGGEWLKPQLESIFSQNDVDVTVYASDDLSTDESHEFLVNLSKIERRLVVLPNMGKFNSAGANFHRLVRCVDLSQFDYVAFADQDDIWFDRKLMHAVDVIKSNCADGYSANVTAFWPSGKKLLINKAQSQRQYDYMFESCGPGCSFVFSKALAKDLKHFLTVNEYECQSIEMHDWFLYAFARSRRYTWIIDPAPQLLYRQHDINVMGANVGIAAKVNRAKIMFEGWHIKQALMIARVLGYDKEFPIWRLKRFTMLDRLILLVAFYQLRRKLNEALALAFYFAVAPKKW